MILLLLTQFAAIATWTRRRPSSSVSSAFSTTKRTRSTTLSSAPIATRGHATHTDGVLGRRSETGLHCASRVESSPTARSKRECQCRCSRTQWIFQNMLVVCAVPRAPGSPGAPARLLREPEPEGGGAEGGGRRRVHVRARGGVLEGRDGLPGAHAHTRQVGAHAPGRVHARHALRSLLPQCSIH